MERWLYHNIFFLFIALFFVQEYVWSDAWDNGDINTFVTFFGERTGRRPVDFLRTKDAFDAAKEEAEESLAQVVDVEQAADSLKGLVEKFFDENRGKLSQYWCRSLEDVHQFVRDMFPGASSHQVAYFRIMMYLEAGDMLWKKESSAFWGDKPPTELSATHRLIVSNYLRDGEGYVFLLRANTEFSFFESLIASSQNKRLFILPIDWKKPWEITTHGGVYRGLCDTLKHDGKHIASNSVSSLILDSYHPNLQKIIVEKMLEVIKENWEEDGIKYTISSFHMSHERCLYKAFLISGDVLQKRVQEFLDYEHGVSDDPGMDPLIRPFAQPFKRNRFTLVCWEKDLWEKVRVKLPVLREDMRKRMVFQEVQRSWFPRSRVDDSKEGYRRVAIKAIECICDNVPDIGEKERAVFLNFAEGEFKNEKGFFMVRQKIISRHAGLALRRGGGRGSYYDQQKLSQSEVLGLKMPKKRDVINSTREGKLLMLEGILHNLAIFMNEREPFLENFPFNHEFVQKLSQHYTREAPLAVH